MVDAAQTILLVEDSPDDVELTLRAFRKSNLMNHIVVARDGVEALEYLHGDGSGGGGAAYERARAAGDTPPGDTPHGDAPPGHEGLPPLPQLVLLDLKLPRIDGLEVLKRLRANERTRYLPVVILTSSLEEQDLVSGYANGANSYIRKPVDFGEFLGAVQQLGGYWLLLNRFPAHSA
jgi:two-component system response regulator